MTISINKGLGLACILFSSLISNAFGETDYTKDFDHASTGFPLEGRHAITECESCHIQSEFSATPNQCSFCHSRTGPVSASAKSLDHINTIDQCADCHNTRSWFSVFRVDHTAVLGTCFSCHNGVQASGQSINHPALGNNCENCHNTYNWANFRL